MPDMDIVCAVTISIHRKVTALMTLRARLESPERPLVPIPARRYDALVRDSPVAQYRRPPTLRKAWLGISCILRGFETVGFQVEGSAYCSLQTLGRA